MFCHLGHFFFFVLAHLLLKGAEPKVFTGVQRNAGRCAVTLYVGEGPRGSNGARLTLLRISVFHSDTHNQTGPLWCWFPSGWACAHSRPLWVSPTTSPVRLGVSPAAAPTPTGAFNQRFEALFPGAGALGYAVCFAPRSSRFICAPVWGRRGATRGSAATRHSACPALRHSESGPLGLSARLWGRSVC